MVKNLPASAGDVGLISGSERSPGKGNGSPLQCSCLENPMVVYSPWDHKESDRTERAHTHTHTRARARVYVRAHVCVRVWMCTRTCPHMLSSSVVSDSLQPHGLQPARLLCSWDFPGKNTGVGCHALLQGLFLTQELNPCLLCLLHCRQILYH